jgi:hypothetical protein
MQKRRIGALVFTCLLGPLAAASCKTTVNGGGAGSAGGAGGGGTLQWYYTCGDPVCRMHHDHAGAPPCTTEKAGDPCTTEGQQCDPIDPCNKLLVCATSDPTKQPGGCPISRARYKHDIRYLPGAELARVHDDLVTMRLATWRYNHEGAEAREHLGFIIDDNPESPSVDASGDHADLYGYTSMAVAAIQVQEKAIAAQQKQLEALRQEVEALRGEVRAFRGSERR